MFELNRNYFSKFCLIESELVKVDKNLANNLKLGNKYSDK